MNQTYLVLTIGPIYKTLNRARSTKEIWAASYLFSFLMEKLVEAMKKHGTIILPAQSQNRDDVKNKVGLYPDRLLVKLKKNNDSLKQLENKSEHVIKSVYQQIQDTCFTSSSDIASIKQYLQVYYLIRELPERQNPIKQLFPMLVAFEQQPAFVMPIDKNNAVYPLEHFFKNITQSKIYQSAFKDGSYFPSIPEIACHELSIIGKVIFADLFNQDTDDEKDLYKGIKEAFGEENSFQYHKYMAMVQADGDNLGMLIDALYEVDGIEAISEISAVLMGFGVEAAKIIEDYGGRAIMLGGDDVLFFAPVKTRKPDQGPTNIFELIDQIDELFRQKLSECDRVIHAISVWNENQQSRKFKKYVSLPTLSFGLAISYHKYPMQEALEEARSLLFETAKNVPGKNALSFRLLKHAGHYIGSTIGKSWKSWQMLPEIMELGAVDKNTLSSIQYKLEPLRPLIRRLLVGRISNADGFSLSEKLAAMLPDEEMREFMLENFSANYFSDSIKDKNVREFLDASFDFLLTAHRDLEDIYGNHQDTADKAIDQLYAVLRLIQFFNQDMIEEDNL